MQGYSHVFEVQPKCGTPKVLPDLEKEALRTIDDETDH